MNFVIKFKNRLNLGGFYTADNGSRTRLSSLGSWCSTDEPYLHNAIIAYLGKKTSIKYFEFPHFVI